MPAARPGRKTRRKTANLDRARRSRPRSRPVRDPAAIEGARKSRLPDKLAPELATLVAEAPPGEDWLSEIKFDGYRVVARLDHGEVRLFTRRGEDWTSRFPSIARSVAALEAPQALVDGEVVMLGEDGKADFQALQNVLSGRRGGNLVYYAFDLVHLNGYDLAEAPLAARKRELLRLVRTNGGSPRVLFSDHVVGRAPEFLDEACRMGLEGIVCKRADRPYRSGRGRDWLKVKCRNRQEFVIGGFTEPAGGRTGFGSLLLGLRERGGLRYVGRVGTGFTGESLRELRKRLGEMEQRSPPFDDPPRGSVRRGVHWSKPDLVAEVEFADWTNDGILRAPSFKGLREDKASTDVKLEEPVKNGPSANPGARRSGKRKETKPSAAGRVRPLGEAIDIAGVRLTHPDRVLYAEQGITKHALALYYLTIAEKILPYVAGRPLTLLRCPEGHDKGCFVQRHANENFPEAIERVEVREAGKTVSYPTVDSVRGLVSLVQLGVLEIHPWGARVDDLERPDRIFFDLDPDPDLPLERLIEATRLVRDRLASLGLESFVKTTGGKGFHVVVPLVRDHGWEEVKSFTAAVTRSIVREAPERYVATASKSKRRGKIFIDYLRNARGATAVAAYSTRARSGAPVSVPLRWPELEEGLRPDSYTIENLPRRLSALRRDPWDGFADVEQSITPKMMKIV